MQTNYEYYKIFYYVAKYLNITRAASALKTSQPSVSRCMQCLEHDLDCTLFIRSKRGVTLTAEGELLYRYIKAGCEQIMEGEAALHNILTYRTGSVHIGATETVLYNYLADKLEDFRSLYPEIDLKVSDFNTPEAIKKLKAGMIDLAIVASPLQADSLIQVKKLSSFQDIVIGGPQYEELASRQFSLNELSSYPFVAMEQGTATAAFLESFFIENNVSITPKLELAGTSLILSMVEHNLGLGFIPDVFAKKAIADKRVFQIKLKETIPRRDISAVTVSNYPLSAAVQAFINTL